MKYIKDYVNLKVDLDLVHLNLKALDEKENTIQKEREVYLELENKLNNILNLIEEKLKDSKGIERELIYEVVIKGFNVTKAVDKVAFLYDMDASTIWKSYYPKVKPFLQEINDLSSVFQVV